MWLSNMALHGWTIGSRQSHDNGWLAMNRCENHYRWLATIRIYWKWPWIISYDSNVKLWKSHARHDVHSLRKMKISCKDKSWLTSKFIRKIPNASKMKDWSQKAESLSTVHSNLRSLSKIWQKLHKNFEIWKILGFFVIFGLNLIYFSFRKQPLSLRKSILDNEFLPFLSRWAFSTF